MGPLRGGFFCRGARGSSKKYVMTGVFDGGGLRKCKPFVFLQCVFLQAVWGPCVAVFFVVGQGVRAVNGRTGFYIMFFMGSKHTQLCFFRKLWYMFYSIVIFMAKRKPLAKLQGGFVRKKTCFVLKNMGYVFFTCLLGFFACGFLFSG